MTDPSALVRAALPRGFVDRDGADIAAAEAMMAKIRTTYALYGFEAVETPFIEMTEALGKFLPDQDRPNEGVFSFKDDDEQWLSLRYDLTAPLARYVAENFDRLAKPYRSYRAGWVFRNEKPGPGRYRQFMQFDADTVGSASPAADAEMCMMAADVMQAVGIARGDYVIKFSNKKLYEGLQESQGLGGPNNAARRLMVLRALDKFDRLGIEGVRNLLGAGRRDESGDFTRGADLNEAQVEANVAFLALTSSSAQTVPKGTIYTNEGLRLRLPGELRSAERNALFSDGLRAVEGILDLIRAVGYEDRIRFETSVVRGLEYYTGPVFEAELTFETPGEDGKPVRFGSVGGGGRYDGLVSRFRPEPVPATGFSIGVSRLQAALSYLGKLESKADLGPVVVTVLDRARIADYQRFVAKLRAEGIRAELYLGTGKMAAQFKYADRRNSPCVIIQGSDEQQRGEVQIKDLIEGTRAAAAIASNQEWRESRPAQFAVPEANLVDAVREVLARQGVHWG